MRAETSEGLRLDDIRTPTVTDAMETRIRNLVARKAENSDDERTLLQMLGVTESPTGPPADPCANPECPVQMFRQHWPPAWKEGRVRYGGHGLCQRCNHKARRAAEKANGTTPKRRRRTTR